MTGVEHDDAPFAVCDLHPRQTDSNRPMVHALTITHEGEDTGTKAKRSVATTAAACISLPCISHARILSRTADCVYREYQHQFKQDCNYYPRSHGLHTLKL